MLERTYTVSGRFLAIGLIFVGTQAWAQNMNESAAAMQSNESHSVVVPPADQQQVDNQDQKLAQRPKANEQIRQGQEQAARTPAEEQMPASRAGREADEASQSAGSAQNALAELGVRLMPHEGPGVLISSVIVGTAADKADLQPGDFLLTIQGESIATPQDARSLIRNKMRPGEKINLTIWRDGSEQTVAATLGEAQIGKVQNSQATTQNVRYFRRQYYRRPYRRYYGYYSRPYYNRYPFYGYGYRYYGVPRFGYYQTPWGGGVRIGPYGYFWR